MRITKRNILNIASFLVLQLSVVLFVYLAYCLFKDIYLIKDTLMDVPMHAVIGLGAHMCLMTGAVSLIHADNFFGRLIYPSSRMTLHGLIMFIAASNSLLSFGLLPFVIDCLFRADKREFYFLEFNHSVFVTHHADLAIALMVFEGLTVCLGFFLYMSRSIMDMGRTQKIWLMWLHNTFGYLTITIGAFTNLTGFLVPKFVPKESVERWSKKAIKKWYRLSVIGMVVISGFTLLHFLYKIYKTFVRTTNK